MSIDQYSTTPANNDLTNYFKTGMRPSSVKNAGWDIMADLASYAVSLPTAGGTANALTVANGRPFGSLVAGLLQMLNPANANTGAATFAPDGLAAKAVFANGVALLGGELQLGVPAWLKYDGTQWNLLNPVRSATVSYAAASGTNAMTATLLPAVSAYYDGLSVKLKIAITTTGAATVNLNGLGAKNVYYPDGVTALLPGSLIQNNIYEFIYDSSLNAAAGGWTCVNPSRITGSFTLTLNGMTTTITGTVNYAIAADGKTVTIWTPAAILGTSNTIGMGSSGVPSILVSATNHRVWVSLQDNGTAVTNGVLFNLNTQSWLFQSGILSNGFTASGTKGLNITQATYSLD